jgi:uncharacterized repeat protein (TIGR03803 family)
MQKIILFTMFAVVLALFARTICLKLGYKLLILDAPMKRSKLIIVAIFLTVTIFVFPTFANAQYTKLHDFDTDVNGGLPYGSLISDGTFLYGMTAFYGNFQGVIFKIKPDGTGYIKLLDFDGVTNGASPEGSLVFDGTFLYGMAQTGGNFNLGVIFKIKPDGTGYAKLLDFGGAINGSLPYGSLNFDGTFLYGMTRTGGSNDLGVIFKIKTDGTGYVKLLDFAGTTNGSYPASMGSLISDGTFLYGITNYGGTNNLGVIFKIKTDGTGYVKLLDFAGTTNGSYPYSSLVSDGTFLYGMTNGGGINNMGVVFKIKSDGTGYIKLLDFAGTANGRTPTGSLLFSGNFLYGTTVGGGASDQGVIFKIMSDGTNYVKLFDFAGTANGSEPYNALIPIGNSLYGMTHTGGSGSFGGAGVIFKYCPPITVTQSITICSGQSITIGTHVHTTSNIYVDSLTSTITGCDSIVTTNLTVSPNMSVSISGSTLTAASPSSSSTYQWIDCSNGNTQVSGATSQNFTPSISGNYAVIVTANFCSDTSVCNAITISTTGITNNAQVAGLSVFPNPNTGDFTISLNKEETFNLVNNLGQTVKTIQLNQSNNNSANVSGVEPGFYFLVGKSNAELNYKIVVAK